MGISYVCDGVPYDFVSQIQDNSRICGVCSASIKIEEMLSHSSMHGENVVYQMPLKRLFFRPGPGHIELNMARKVLSFLWTVIMKNIATELGFRTPNALKVFKNGIDHHRSCQVIESCLSAFAKELLVPYVRMCIQENSIPTANDYETWYTESVDSKKYGFLFHITFWYLLSFKVFKEGVRKNNSDSMMAGRTVFAPLFYCGHHPKYQRLFLRDLVERVKYPENVTAYIKSTESHSVSGDLDKGQGGDFIHEEVNKNIKSYLQGCGIPTKRIWVNIIRKAKTLDVIKDKIVENTDINNKSGKKRPKKFAHEITMIRKMIREAHYLDSYDVEDELITSISGDVLDKSLCDFSYTAKENYKTY